VPQLLDALVAFLHEQVVYFFKRKVGSFWVEEVDQGNISEVEAHEDEVCLPTQL
jgi:hypothetical protein